MFVLLSFAFAADPAMTCLGSQLCDGKCISLIEVCPTAPPAPVTTVPVVDDTICRVNPLPKAGEPPVNADAVRKAAKAVCVVGSFMGPGCDPDSPMLYERPKENVEPPCGGPPVPPPATGAKSTGEGENAEK